MKKSISLLRLDASEITGNQKIIAAAWIGMIESAGKAGIMVEAKKNKNNIVLSWSSGLTVGITKSNQLLIANGRGGKENKERVENYFKADL